MLSLVKYCLPGKILFFIFILLYSFLYSTIINVPTPYATIQNGIDAATNSDTVLVQPGTYVENIDYNGKLITVGSLFLTTQDTTYISSTIIDGNSSSRVVTFTNDENSSAVLCGFTITNGLASGAYPANWGGGIYCDESSPSIKNVKITNNSADHGGGIFCYSYSSPSLENVIITGNSTSGIAGGIYCYNNSNPSLQNVTISGNSAGSYGGGICCNSSSPSLINSIFWNNLPQEIYIETGSVTATYSDIEGGFPGTGNIDSDPLFVAPGNGDYHLQATSPCIDAGDPASPLDPDCTIIDMGAYYFHQQYNGPVWHISTTGSDITGTGCEQCPFATIQHGINVSSNSDTVLVQPGTYMENINYNGKLITVGSLFLTIQDTTYISSTTIDGNNSGKVVIFENSEDSTAILCGFTITNGLASGSWPDNYGGGIYCNYSSPSLENLTITGNSADGDGGGIYCDNSSPSLENLTITDNSADAHGGGIYCWDNSSPNLENLTITDNSAEGGGGGIYCWHSSPSLQNVTISSDSGSFGGGVYFYNYSSPSLENVTISGNSSFYHGGGIYCSHYSSPSLVNVTISDNSADGDGGGIYSTNSSPVLINSILWNDSPDEIYINSGSVTATYSDIEGGFTGTGNIDSYPLFVDPVNGDYNLTWANYPIPDTTMSPCIDAGDPASPLDPDGTIADMGAYYFHQTIAPDPPQNVTIEIIGTDVHISWDAVTGANSYKVYSSDDPYTGFVEDTSGSFAGESWSAPIGDIKKFYYIKASTETIRSKDSHSQDAYHYDRKLKGYDSDKFINRRRK